MDGGKQGDGELVRRARGGDRDAFTALVGRYRDMVYGTAYHYLGNAEDAQDAAQEAFVSAYSRLGQLREAEKFAPWLRRLTLNGCADILRRRGTRQTCWDGACPEAALPDEAERLTTRLAVQEALSRLPERMRLTVTLCYLDGYSHAEVARFLDIPRNTVRSRLQHATHRLREEMRDMVVEQLNQGKPDEGWIRQVVDEALRRGEAAQRAYENGEAARHYDEALTAIERLPPGPERKRLAMDALRQKGNVLRYSSRAAALGLLEEALTAAQELHALEAQAEILQSVGGLLTNKEPEKASEAYLKALGLYREMGDVLGQGNCLLWLGMQSVHRNEISTGRSYLEQAQPLFERVNSLDWLAVCRALLDLMQEPRVSDFSSLILWRAVCDTWEADAGQIKFHSQPGFAVTRREDDVPPQIYAGSVFWQASYLHTYLDSSVPVGGSWSGNAFSSTAEPLKATVTVLSDAENVTTPAGTFPGCLLTEQVTTENGPSAEENAGFRGTVRAWYAPGVGLVQTEVQTEVRHDGLEATLQLQAYEITAESCDFLPLAVGNRWEYGVRDLPAEYAAKEAYRITAQDGNLWYVEHYAYAYRR